MTKRIFQALCSLPLLLLMAGSVPAEDKESTSEEPMTNARLERILKALDPGIKGENGRWEMVQDGVTLLILSDESFNRIRVVAPVAEAQGVDEPMLMRMMEANFTSSLDARYAIFQGMVWTIFAHPLDSLRERDLVSGLKQVINLVKTTGTSYSSTGLRFGPPYQEK